MKISETIAAEIRWAHEMLGILWQFTPRQLPRTDRNEIAIALSSLALEHANSVLTLIATGESNGSAFALIRPTIEAALRAVWLYVAATDQDVVRAKSGDRAVYKPLAEMAADVDNTARTEKLFARMVSDARSLHGLTHGGIEQILRRFDANGDVVPTYSEAAVRECVRGTVTVCTTMMLVMCHLGQTDSARIQERVDAFQSAFMPMMALLDPII